MKKFLSLFLAIALIACLCACGTQPAQTQPSEQQPAQQPAQNEPAAPAEETTGETIHLKVWGSQPDQELLKELCEAFAADKLGIINAAFLNFCFHIVTCANFDNIF